MGIRASVFFTGLLLALPVAAEDEVILGTSILPPYQTEHDGQLGGRSVDIMNCVFEELDYDWHGRVMPWPRARSQIEGGELDGFFTGMADAQLHEYARASVPLALEKWYWFARSGEVFQQEAFAHTHPPTLPIAESIAKRCFSLPMYPELSLTDADRVIAAIAHSVRA